MKAITISQPYASLIATGEKFVENRTWNCNYRGPIAIHAGLGRQYLTKAELAKYPTGCVIAIAQLVACKRIEVIKINAHQAGYKNCIDSTNRTWRDVFLHVHTEGPYCWILDEIQQIEPVKAVGKQGLWEWEPEQIIERLPGTSMCQTSMAKD